MQTVKDYLKSIEAPAGEYRPPVNNCQTCDDVGFVRYPYPKDHPMFGQIFPCPDCSQKIVTSPDKYGLLPADRVLTWDDVYSLHPSIDQAKEVVKAAIGQGYGWVYLWGGYGTAKTTILKAAVAEYLREGAQASYLRMADLMDEIRLAYDAGNPQVELQAKLKWFVGLPLLAVDEAEKIHETGFVEERRFQILDARYEAATRSQVGVTLLSANVAPDKLPPAIKSRVMDTRFAVVHISAKDMRQSGDLFRPGMEDD